MRATLIERSWPAPCPLTSASHGVFAKDCNDPITILATMRAQVVAYPTVCVVDEAAVGMVHANITFSFTSTKSEVLRPRCYLRSGLQTSCPTDVSGGFAAGDITRSGDTVIFTCADGVTAALAMHRSLIS
jgi:thioredoxin reductase